MSGQASTVPDSQHASRQGASQTSAAPSQAEQEAQNKLTERVLVDLLSKIPTCNTLGELVRALPVPAQPSAKGILDRVYGAAHRLGAAEVLLQTWRDVLRTSDWEKVAQLNSIRIPNLQVCKEALGPEDDGLSSMNLDDWLRESKKSALTRMIEIKNKEVTNLRQVIQPRAIASDLTTAWSEAVTREASLITAEAQAVMTMPMLAQKVAQSAAAIGVSSYEKAKKVKENRISTKKSARIGAQELNDTPMGGTGDGPTQNQLRALVGEAVKRQMQSQKDRGLAGKGKRRTAPSKTKKVQKRPGKRQRESAAKAKAKPSGKQLLRRSNAVRRA